METRALKGQGRKSTRTGLWTEGGATNQCALSRMGIERRAVAAVFPCHPLLAWRIAMFVSAIYPTVVADPAPAMNVATIPDPAPLASATAAVVAIAIAAAVATSLLRVTFFTFHVLWTCNQKGQAGQVIVRLIREGSGRPAFNPCASWLSSWMEWGCLRRFSASKTNLLVQTAPWRIPLLRMIRGAKYGHITHARGHWTVAFPDCVSSGRTRRSQVECQVEGKPELLHCVPSSGQSHLTAEPDRWHGAIRFGPARGRCQVPRRWLSEKMRFSISREGLPLLSWVSAPNSYPSFRQKPIAFEFSCRTYSRMDGQPSRASRTSMARAASAPRPLP